MKTPSFFLALLLLVSMGSNTYAETRGVYLHNDLFGTAVAATNEAGEVIWRKDYMPYGETKSKDGANSVGFTGHQEDDLTGLTQMQRRFYDPQIGQFLSQDPAGFTESNPMSFNRYAYANNNPYKFVDPDGKEVQGAAVILFGKTLGVYRNTDTGERGYYTSGKVSFTAVIKSAAQSVKGNEIKIKPTGYISEVAPDQNAFNNQKSVEMKGLSPLPYAYGETNTGGSLKLFGKNNIPTYNTKNMPEGYTKADRTIDAHPVFMGNSSDDSQSNSSEKKEKSD